MLFLLFQLGKDRYALDASRVVEVAPLLAMKRLPQAPKGVAGIFNYRGRPVPAVDLCEMATGAPASERLSTRIILVHFTPKNGRTGSAAPADAKAPSYVLGLLAESVTEMQTFDAGQFKPPVVSTANAPFLGDIASSDTDARFVQLVRVEELLPAELQDVLFAEQKG